MLHRSKYPKKILQIQRMLLHATLCTLISHLADKCEKAHIAGKFPNNTGGWERVNLI